MLLPSSTLYFSIPSEFSHDFISYFHCLTIINIIQVVIYSKSYCPYCDTTKQLFQTKFPDLIPHVIELNEISDGSAIQSTLASMTGQRTVPSVWVNGNHVGGNDDTHSLFRSGQLTEMLK